MKTAQLVDRANRCLEREPDHSFIDVCAILALADEAVRVGEYGVAAHQFLFAMFASKNADNKRTFWDVASTYMSVDLDIEMKLMLSGDQPAHRVKWINQPLTIRKHVAAICIHPGTMRAHVAPTWPVREGLAKL